MMDPRMYGQNVMLGGTAMTARAQEAVKWGAVGSVCGVGWVVVGCCAVHPGPGGGVRSRTPGIADRHARMYAEKMRTRAGTCRCHVNLNL